MRLPKKARRQYVYVERLNKWLCDSPECLRHVPAERRPSK